MTLHPAFLAHGNAVYDGIAETMIDAVGKSPLPSL
jgi:hypothetical protein